MGQEYSMFKELPEEYIDRRLKKLFNDLLDGQRYLEEWKQAEIMMIPKQGKRKLPQNYKPISLLIRTSKIM